MRRSWLLILLLALIGGTSAAFAVTQSLKDERSPVGIPEFDRVLAPAPDCGRVGAELKLRLRRADRVTAEIVDADGRLVSTLADNRPHRRGPVTFTWNGCTADAEIVPDGRYRLKIRLDRQDRTLLLPTTIRVDATAPVARIVALHPRELALDRNGKIGVVYRADEQSAAMLSLSGEGLPETVVNRGRFRPAGRAKINWAGRVDGEPAAPGEYTLTLRVRDRAGNVSAPVARRLRVVKAEG